MIPVDQTIFEDGKGDCLRACVATVIGARLETIPNFAADGSYWSGAIKWLAEKKQHRVLQVTFFGNGYDHCQYFCCPDLPCILSGYSPRFSTDGKRKQHAVVGRASGYSFTIEHDPHPSREGIVGEPFSVTWIFPVSHVEATGECYRKLIEPLREVARAHGYALGVHGSLERDIDLIAAPWAEPASIPAVLAEAIRAKAEELNGVAFMNPHESDDWFQAGCPGHKPHGRLCWSYHLGAGPYIDLSVLPPMPDFKHDGWPR